jgi:hypothetical protein
MSFASMTIFRRAVLLGLACLACAASEAGATLGIENHNDPAGDTTRINYRLESPSFSAPIPFTLDGGAYHYTSFGVQPGTYTVQALPPTGWAVGDIQCVGPDEGDFAIDVANGRVTVTHGAAEEHICAFTNRKLSPGGGAPSPGVSPTPSRAELPKVVIPRRPALVGVKAGRGYAEATIRITRRSVIKGWLLRHKSRVVGRKRIVRAAGTHAIRVKLQPKRMRRMQRRGMKRVTLTLRIAVTARAGATHVFRHRVVVTL